MREDKLFLPSAGISTSLLRIEKLVTSTSKPYIRIRIRSRAHGTYLFPIKICNNYKVRCAAAVVLLSVLYFYRVFCLCTCNNAWEISERGLKDTSSERVGVLMVNDLSRKYYTLEAVAEENSVVDLLTIQNARRVNIENLWREPFTEVIKLMEKMCLRYIDILPLYAPNCKYNVFFHVWCNSVL